MSAMMSSRVTDDSRARAARTIAPRFIVEHGSLANSPDATRICSPASVKQKLQNNWRKNFEERLHGGGVIFHWKFKVMLNCFCSRPIGTLVDSMRTIRMSGPLGTVLSGVGKS